MDFIHEIKEFLDVIKKEKGEATTNTYKSKIYEFFEFVSLELRELDVTYIYFLNVMNKDKLLQSVEYYVKAGNLKSRAAVDVYFSVLGNFYKFLSIKYGETNDYFQDNIKKEEFKEAFERKIKELGLRESDTQEPIGREMAEKILEECDKIIDGIDIEKILSKEKGVYSNYISSLITKLVLAYGLKNDAIRKLKIKDYNDQLYDLMINNYRVRLPDGLAMQMKKYKEIRKRFLEKYKIESKRLFFDDYDIDKELDNTKMYIVLKKVMGNMQAGGVAKYAIIQLLRENIPAYIISDFTNYKEDVLDYCQEQVDAERGLSLLSEKSRILDSALRKNELFDVM